MGGETIGMGDTGLTGECDSGNEIGPFRAIEESTLAHLTDASVRTDIFAWYTLIGSAGAACGTIVSGFVVHYLQSLDGWDDIRAYRAIFFAYSAFGVMKFILACSLSSKTEFRPAPAAPEPVADASETSPLLPDGDRTTDAEEENLKPKAKRSFLPTISKSSRIVVAQLVLLLGLDSFASGLVPM